MQCSGAQRKKQLHYSASSCYHWLFSPPAGPMAALITPNCTPLCSPWLSWPKSQQIHFPCHSAKSSILSVKEKFMRQQNRKTWKLFIKHQFFSLRNSSLTQAWCMCLSVCSAKVPLLSPHYLAWKVDPVTACISTLREIRDLSTAWSGGIHAVL